MTDKTPTPFDQVSNPIMPRTGNTVTSWIGRSIMRSLGWSIRGKLPEIEKVVYIGAPHTSNWDMIIGVSAMMAVNLKCHWMMKKEAFSWPLGGLWKALGGVPVERSKKTDIGGQMVDWFAQSDKAWLGITPEGTRSEVEGFKKGYLTIAYAAKVPVFLVAIDGANKQIVLDKLWPLTGDAETDNTAIKAYYDATYVGIKS